MQTSQNILVVEDDPFISMDIEDCVTSAGRTVLGPANSVVTALDLIDRQRPDLAILDVELLDGLSFPIARKLEELGVAFAFVTAQPGMVATAGFDRARVVTKPFDLDQIKALLG